MSGICTCPHVGCFIVSQWRNAFSLKSNIHSGSPFLAEMSRTTSSLSPLSIMSVWTSVVKPNSYFCSAIRFTSSLSLSVGRPSSMESSSSFLFLMISSIRPCSPICLQSYEESVAEQKESPYFLKPSQRFRHAGRPSQRCRQNLTALPMLRFHDGISVRLPHNFSEIARQFH